ncbi:hypothetical protein CW745_03665 [Psychromonas sp. psych-6C06]|uniref:FkbM family methyltransferase n=1 Tax=Psychromonas sp. psych-6C06 TaxID=2058089 RepID=UPI000C332E44|nr:FkbM family methyltransferase [Psychromonas sp. psych-6C06]PKF62535.1 hypothetical protein CW745_03665 [Psychromonas sp. psych-6C06]
MTKNLVLLREHGVDYTICLPHKETDYIQKKIATALVPYELSMLEDMRSRLSEGDNVIDVGANVGNHTLYLASVVKCNVHAFEPNKSLCEAMEVSRTENRLENKVTIHDCALGAKEEKACFEAINNDNLGGQSIEITDEADIETFDVKALDSFDWKAPISLIKIDVEGFELEVLKGGKALILRDKPDIYIECLSETDFTTISNLLTEFGYSYWDTFNASPTHLYIANEKISLDDKINHIVTKNLRELYSAQMDATQLRKQLHECNLKYRNVTQSANERQIELSVLQEKYDAVSKQSNTIEQERAQNKSLEQELLKLNESLRNIEQEKEQLSIVHAKLDAANEKYRLACQRIDDLKQLNDDKASIILSSQENESVLQEQLSTGLLQIESLKKELKAQKSELVTLLKKELQENQRINELVEQQSTHIQRIAELENKLILIEQQKLSEQESLQREVIALQSSMEVKDKNLQASSDENSKLGAEVTHLTDTLSSLNQQQQDLSERYAICTEYLSETERKLTESTIVFKEVKANFDELELSAQDDKLQLQEVGQQLEQSLASLTLIKQEKSDLEQEVATLFDEVTQLEASLVTESESKKAITVKMDKLSAEFRNELKILNANKVTLAEQYQASVSALSEEKDLLEQRNESLNVELSDLWDEHEETLIELDKSAISLNVANERLQLLSTELSEQSEKIRLLKVEYSNIQAQLSSAHIKSEHLEKTNADDKSNVIELEKQLAEKALMIEQSKDAQLTLALQCADAKKEIDRLNNYSSQLERLLDNANQKYRTATAEQIPELKNKWEAELEHRRKLQLEVEQLKESLKKANNENVLAKKRVLAIRSSNTFKAGTLLKKHIKTPVGWAKLPVGLWRLYKQSTNRAKPVTPLESKISHSLKTSPAFERKENTVTIELHSNADDISALYLNDHIKNSNLKVACIMDNFTYQSYLPECELQQLTPANWQKELQEFQPEMLFIESAWRGKDELWGSKVGHLSDEVKNIIKWCNAHNVPTAFWNKEDPIHFETFLNTAKRFDHVFTTDIDCIQRYKAALKHENVYFLPFACQPLTNNPLEKYQRKSAVSFAGAYYVKYPERTKDLESFVKDLPKFKTLDIYDRNYGKQDSNYQFPEVYNPYIVGTLPFKEIDKAYKGYDYAINLNSIKQSQSMFARRVYELLASNTVTISNFSQGVRLLFADLVITTDDGKEAVSRLQKVEGMAHGIERLKLIALRKVMSEHTYQDRLNYVQNKVLNKPLTMTLPTIGIVSKIKNSAQLEILLNNVNKQEHVSTELVVVVNSKKVKQELEEGLKQAPFKTTLLLHSEFNQHALAELFTEASWITYFSVHDYVGQAYLHDLVLATRYSCAKVIGKGACFEWKKGHLIEPKTNIFYQSANKLSARSAIISLTLLNDVSCKQWLKTVSECAYQYPEQLSIDPYNYCLNRGLELYDADIAGVETKVADLPFNTGISLNELLDEAEKIQPVLSQADNCMSIKGEQFTELLKIKDAKQVKLEAEQGGLNVHSTLADAKHDYLYANQDIARVDFSEAEVNATLPIHFDIEPGLNISIVLLYLDANKQRISHHILQANRNHTVDLPFETEFIRFGLRVLSSGEAKIKSLIFGHKDLQPEKVFGQSEFLILTNHYPSYDDLYRNGFVHSRAKAYQEHHVNVDIFRLRQGEPISWHEFQNINVITGAQAALRKMLKSGQYKHVLVHFLDAQMWEVLSEFIDKIKVTVWVHGAEVQPWYRRKVLFDTEDKIAVGEAQFEEKKLLWNTVLKYKSENLHFVFVSNYLADTTMEDYSVDGNELSYSIISNPINTDLFTYQEKEAHQRKKILSIRPYASKIYANDLAVSAVLELSKKTFFSELEFHFVGDGPLFDEVLAPIKHFSNVKIEQKFLTQDEIAKLHKEYGVFLCPSRMDTQGVSRDEAMASGLVPVTNSVAAIPEFLNDDEGYLATAENYVEIANAIESIVMTDGDFENRSQLSSQNIKQRRSQESIATLELNVIKLG